MLRWIANLMIVSMIFFPDSCFYEVPQDYGLDYEKVHVQTTDGVKLHGWFLSAGEGEKGVLLFFHGNAGNISSRLFKAKGWTDRGFSVFLIDYRSYGKSEGAIRHGDDLLKDARAAFDWLRQEKNFPVEKIVLYGESLGTYPTIRLGAEHGVAGVVLESPYTSFADLARKHYPFIPRMISDSLIRDFKFPNEEWVAQVKAPLFIIHGTDDEICPYPMAERIFELAPEPKGFFPVKGGTHNDLSAAGEDYWEKPCRFLLEYLK